jgi:hypothetical protein
VEKAAQSVQGCEASRFLAFCLQKNHLCHSCLFFRQDEAMPSPFNLIFKGFLSLRQAERCGLSGFFRFDENSLL